MRSLLFNREYRQRGFTLIELVMVMIIMGILAAVSIPRFADVDQFRERAFADGALAAVRYFQKVAISSGCDVLVQFNAEGARPAEIYATQHNSCNSPPEFTVNEFETLNPVHVMNPSGDNIPDAGANLRFIVQAPADYDIDAADIFFDKVGRPHQVVAGATRNFYTNNVTIALRRPDATAFNQLQTEADTGFARLVGP